MSPNDSAQAIALISVAVTREGGRWGDLGAGSGTFSRALAALLGPTGTVYAVDRDAGALGQIAGGDRERAKRAEIRTVVGDFTEPLELPTARRRGDRERVALRAVCGPGARPSAGRDAGRGASAARRRGVRTADREPVGPYPITSRRWERSPERRGSRPPSFLLPSRRSTTAAIYSVVVRRK